MHPTKPKKTRRQYSVWRSWDVLLCFAAFLFGSGTAIMYAYYMKIWQWSFPALLFVVLAKRLYDREIPRGMAFRWITGGIRAVLYTAAIGGILLPYLLRASSDLKWTYRIQRAIYLSNYQPDSPLYTLLPERLPASAEDYSARFVPSFLQGAAAVDICYYTDSSTIAEYKRIAAESGAAHSVYEPNEAEPENERWFRTMRQLGASEADVETAEIYFFPEQGLWMLNEQTGYFRIYW